MALQPLRTEPSVRKGCLFRAIAVALPLVILLVAEAVLRWAGYGGYPPFLREAGRLPSGETLCMVEPTASKPYFFANPKRPGYADQTNFRMPKPAGTRRIFLIGESAAKGYPQPPNLSMASFLSAMLSDLQPTNRVEVIDLGTTAVASFPLVYVVRDALRFDPDLLVFYMGNNEFFGAYGTASIHGAFRLPPWAQRGMRAARGLALAQAAAAWIHGRKQEDLTLMEEVIGRAFIAADSPLRIAAGRNLAENLETMLGLARAAGVPALVCTTASNEAGLAPLGEDDESGLDESGRAELHRLLRDSEAELVQDPAAAEASARAALARAPRHARAQFLLGRALAAQGNPTAAGEAFLRARDLDTMPWRPTSQTENAIRQTAKAQGVPLCDLAALFRAENPDGATGWELLDDHVHLSKIGQARAARAMAVAIGKMEGPFRTEFDAFAGLPDDEAYARRLGENFYDDYRVHHTLRVLFGVGFMKRSNPEAFARYDRLCREAEAKMSADLRQVAHEWQTLTPHAGGLRPITAMAARVLLRENKTAEALPLYELAQRQVPDFTSWHLEYVYFALACRERLSGRLTETDLAEANAGIAQGRFLLAHGDSKTGLTERYIGRLHQLRGEWAEAIPYLEAARPRMRAEDLVACDQALATSYLRTGRKADAIALAEDGIQHSGSFAGIYRQLRAGMEATQPQ